MKYQRYRGKVVCIFDEYTDVAELEELQNKCEKQERDFIWVALDGVESANLKPEYSLTENYEHSLINSLMWKGYFTEDEQNTRIWEMIDTFIDNGKQFLVEEYEFVEDEPFYDYSGGRD
jgi:hypothetical protein